MENNEDNLVNIFLNSSQMLSNTACTSSAFVTAEENASTSQGSSYVDLVSPEHDQLLHLLRQWGLENVYIRLQCM